MMRRLLFVFIVLSVLPLRANLADSVADCVKRYGKPVGYSEASATMPFGTLVFTAGGYQLVVYLIGDMEVGARVAKTDKAAFSPAEMKTIMDAEMVPNSPWLPTATDDPTCIQWTRADKATALYDKDKHLLIFTSAKMQEANRAAQAAMKKAAPAPVVAPTNAPAAAAVPTAK